MTKYIYNDFSLGEISPEFFGRDDTEIYTKGCVNAANMYILPSGSIKNREGSKLINIDERPFVTFLTGENYYLVIFDATYKVLDGEGNVLAEEKNVSIPLLKPANPLVAANSNSNLLTASSFFFNRKLYIGTTAGLFRFRVTGSLYLLEKVKVIADPVAGNFDNSTAFFGRVLVASENVLHFSQVKTTDEVNFTTGTTATSGFNIPFNFGLNEKIQWIKTGYKYLYVGTTFGVYLITGSSKDLPPAPSSGSNTGELGYMIKRIDTHGRSSTSSSPAITVGSHLYFASDFAVHRVKTLTSDVEVAEQVSVLAGHLFDSRIASIKVDSRFDNQLLILLENGKLLTLCFQEGTGAVGFTHHELSNELDFYYYLCDNSAAVSKRIIEGLSSPQYCLEKFLNWDFRERQGVDYSTFDPQKSRNIQNCAYLDCIDYSIRLVDIKGTVYYLSNTHRFDIVNPDYSQDTPEQSHEFYLWGLTFKVGEKIRITTTRGVNAGIHLVTITEASSSANLVQLSFQCDVLLPTENNCLMDLIIKKSIYPAGTKLSLISDFKLPEDAIVGADGFIEGVEKYMNSSLMVISGLRYKPFLALLPFRGSGRFLGSTYNAMKINVFRSFSFDVKCQGSPDDRVSRTQLRDFSTGVFNVTVATTNAFDNTQHITIYPQQTKPLIILNILSKRQEGDF